MTDITDNQSRIEFTKNYEELIKSVVGAAFEYENIKPRSVSVMLCDDDEIQKLNAKFRNIDKPTDVLSFPMYDENGELDETELGDIVISLERAKKQAEEYGHSFEREIAFLTAHSMLHLFGYDHIDDGEREEMFEKQEDILSKLGISRGDSNNV